LADLNPASEPAAARPGGRGPLFYIGAAGLTVATAVETVAVAGRWLSLPLHGALEIIQAAVLITACVSMLTATLASTHATVHLLLNRVSAPLRTLLTRSGSLLAAVFFVGLTIASVWLQLEHWDGHEESELLHIPFRPLRLLCSVSMLLIAAVFAYRTIKPRAQER
jgi:TRAP-type C4-dicarboxylate transport system permease small subunit